MIFADSTELITHKLQFTEVRDSVENEPILYEEKTGLSRKVILQNKTNSETEVDYELFFNGILTNTESIINSLKN
jgi:hypothetical protein